MVLAGKGACPWPHIVRTINMTGVMLRRSGRIKAGLEERMLNRFCILASKTLHLQ